MNRRASLRSGLAVTAQAAATGTIIGFLVIVWMTISAKWPAAVGQWASPFHTFMITVIGTLTILLVGQLMTATRGRRNVASGDNEFADLH